jgi:hypothetical protein
MNSQELRQEIDIKRPKYLAKYFPLMEAISDKGSSTGGDYIKFGPFFQTYMYAFMIGYHLGECRTIVGAGETKDFAPLNHWKPNELVDYILMLILSEPEEKIGFTWEALEDMSDEECKAAVGTIIRRIEGYANTGLNYIQDKFNNEKDEFRSPNVFINILREVVDNKRQ